MRIWNRALITLLNPGGLEPEPGNISEFKDARKPKPNKAKPEPGPGTSVVGPYAGCQGGRGGGGAGALLCPLRPPGSCRPGARRSLPGALSGPAGGLSFRFLLCNTKVAKAAAQQSRSAARGSPTGRWRRARAHAGGHARPGRSREAGGEGGGSGAPAR